MTTLSIPLLLTSNVKVMRITTLPTLSGQPLFITDANHQRVPYPASMGPNFWWTTFYDDSAWLAPVLAPGEEPAIEPLHYVDGHFGFEGSMDGDPLWPIHPDPDPNATMLVRWRFTTPSFIVGGAPIFIYNTSSRQGSPTFGYLNITDPTGFGEINNGGTHGTNFLGGDLLAGTVIEADPYLNSFLGRLRPGAENLLAFTVPYHGYNFTSGTLVDRGGFTHTWWGVCILIRLAAGAGRSSVQFVG